jgi:hypothetical protein
MMWSHQRFSVALGNTAIWALLVSLGGRPRKLAAQGFVLEADTFAECAPTGCSKAEIPITY